MCCIYIIYKYMQYIWGKGPKKFKVSYSPCKTFFFFTLLLICFSKFYSLFISYTLKTKSLDIGNFNVRAEKVQPTCFTLRTRSCCIKFTAQRRAMEFPCFLLTNLLSKEEESSDPLTILAQSWPTHRRGSLIGTGKFSGERKQKI